MEHVAQGMPSVRVWVVVVSPGSEDDVHVDNTSAADVVVVSRVHGAETAVHAVVSVVVARDGETRSAVCGRRGGNGRTLDTLRHGHTREAEEHCTEND